MKAINLLNRNLVRPSLFQNTSLRHFNAKNKDSGFRDWQKTSAKFGKDGGNQYRAEYEKEVKTRTDRKLNWGI